MKNAKLWSVLCAAVLLALCVAGVLFTGAWASETRIPTATTTYVVGTDGATIRACLEKAATQTWDSEDVLKIQFSGTDSSAYASPDAANGVSGHTLFEVTTIFRADNTKLPIVIEGTDADRAATLKFAQNDYSATNDYYFTSLTIGGGASGKSIKLYAGCGEVVFENTKHNNSSYTYYFGDNHATDTFEGWDAAKLAANVNEEGLLVTGITFGEGVTGLFQSGSSGTHIAAVGYDGNAECNPVLYALKRSAADVKTVLTDDEVAAVREAAPLATYKKGNVVAIADCVVKPWDTEAYIVLDNGQVADKDDTTPDYPTSGPRFGVMPVRKATLTQLSGGNQYLCAGDAASGTNEVYVGDTYIIFRGGRSGEKMEIAGYSDVGIRLTQKSQHVGNMVFEVHEDDPAMPTYTPWVQCSADITTSRIFGDFHFLMTGGEIGRGYSNYNAAGTSKVYSDGNDGYWGAPLATGSIVNEVRGGQIWAFYGSRFSNAYENTPVSTVLPGTGETLTVKVSIHNKISGGIIGGDKITGDNAKETQSGVKGFFGQYKGTTDKAVKSVCNEITGGTIYAFNAGNSGHSSEPGDIYNFISGTAEQYPTFLSHFHGSTSTVTTDKVVNVIKGYPVFQNKAGEKQSIYGGCKNGTVENVTTYLGGMPVFDDFYGGVCGAAPTGDETDSDCEGVAGNIHSIIALDETTSSISNYVWGGNGYHTISGVDGAKENVGNSENYVSKSITMDVYSGHYGTLRAESACGKQDNVPVTVNVYGGKWSSSFMAVNRTASKGSTSVKNSVVTTNIYDGTFATCYMGGQNARNQEFINNVYGGTFSKYYYGGGNGWAKKITNNIYGGNFAGGYAGGGSACGFESVTNNIYGGVFGNTITMGAYSNPSVASNIYADQVINNNIYGGEYLAWVYCGYRNGTAGTINNHFYSGENNPVRDAENELYKYFDKDGKTTLEGGAYFHDQVVCGSGYNEVNINTNYAEAINNTFAGGLWTKASGGYTDITIRSGMRWGIVKNVTNNFVKGNYYRFFGGCDYGRVLETATNNFGAALSEGETAPVLTFSSYALGGGNDMADVDAKIKAAKAATAPTDTQKAWLAIAEKYGEDFDIGTEYIVNNIYYGTFHQFYGGSYGSNTATIHSGINTITNNVYGGTFDKLSDESTVFAGGCFRSAVIENGIINNIEACTVNGNWYGGSIGTGTVSCPSITNTINGFTGNASANAQVYLGNGAPDFNGVVKTTINDFDAKKSYVYGGSSNIHNQPADASYAIETTINGGTFCGFWGLGSGGSCVTTGNVKTTVNGGVFNGYGSTMPNAMMGGPRNATLTGNIELIINDGTFTADVIGGTLWGSQSAACDTITGNVTTTIKGGDFQGDVYALSRHPAEDLKATGTVTLNVEQTAGKTLKIGGAITANSFTAIDENVELGRNASLTVEKLNGTLKLKQVEGWIAKDYVSLPAGSAYTVEESADCFGKYGSDDSIRIYGIGIDAAGATIILDTRLGARILFNKAEVDQIGDYFEVEAKLGDVVLATASYKNLEEYRGYYSMIVNGIGITDYAEDFTVSGQASLAISMEDLVNMGQKAWTGKWLDLCNSLENFHNVYNLSQTGAYMPEAVADTMTARRGTAGAEIYSATASVLMSDAAGLRLNLVLRTNPQDLTVKVNGEAVSNCATVTEVVIGGNTYYNAQIDLFFKAGAMETQFEVEVSSASGTYMTYGDTVANLAYKLASDSSNEYRDNATALLYYIQKACDCVE